ncbi:hypothetical protein HYU17_02720 [Candidatus Woesearchaeota archaeon]|nr:hypothetical protein [Candidatus Woesearchaeota archaeon]
MLQLLSDVDGRIRHLLVASLGRFDEYRVKGILRAFPSDVELTFVYSHMDSREFAQGLLIPDSLAFHRQGLGKLVEETSPGRTVNFLGLERVPHTWVQDLFHAYGGRRLMSSFPQAFSGFISSMISPNPVFSGSLEAQAANISNTSAELLAKPFWGQKGFTVLPNHHDKIIEGGDLIVVDDTVFVGEYAAQFEFSGQLMVRGISEGSLPQGIRNKVYEEVKNSVLRRIRRYDDSRLFRLVNNSVRDHLDMFFTPLPGGAVAVGDVRTALQHLKLPSNIRVVSQYQHLGAALDVFADGLAKKQEVVRIPALPSFYDTDLPVKRKSDITGETIFGQTMRISWNNVLLERFREASGKQVNCIYVPEYLPPGQLPLLSHSKAVAEKHFTRLDSDRFLELQQIAMDTYMKQGLAVVPVPFYSFYGHDGGLRCSVKVLERG